MTGGYRRIKLFSLMVALLVAGLAVVGGTWAIGTFDGAGTPVADDKDYDVALKYHNGNDYVATTDENANYFGNGFWCPGKTQIVYLKVENEESFPVRTTVKLNVIKSTFGDVMEYAFYTSANDLWNDTEAPSDWIEFKERADENTGILKNGETYLLNQLYLAGQDNNATVEQNNEQVVEPYIALAVHMNEKASNNDQNQTMNLRFSLQIDSLFDTEGNQENTDSSAENGNT